MSKTKATFYTPPNQSMVAINSFLRDNGTYVRQKRFESLVDSLFRIVIKTSGVTKEAMEGPLQKRYIADARKVFCAIAHFHIKPIYGKIFTWGYIADKILKDHSTAISAVKRHNDFMDSKNIVYMNLYNEVVKAFTPYILDDTKDDSHALIKSVNKQILDLLKYRNKLLEHVRESGQTGDWQDKDETNDYELLPLESIHPTARRIAVRWCEQSGNPEMGFLQHKHKLASDIMNFAMSNLPTQKPTNNNTQKA